MRRAKFRTEDLGLIFEWLRLHGIVSKHAIRPLVRLFDILSLRQAVVVSLLIHQQLLLVLPFVALAPLIALVIGENHVRGLVMVGSRVGTIQI